MQYPLHSATALSLHEHLAGKALGPYMKLMEEWTRIVPKPTSRAVDSAPLVDLLESTLLIGRALVGQRSVEVRSSALRS